MKKLILVALCFVQSFAFSQTATDFTANDCDGTSHNLFSELNSGKVIVLCWVMPCGACTGPALTTMNVVQSYMGSNPHTVYMYLVDDYANTSCTALDSWKNNVGLTSVTSFSDASISMANYGGNGMPKIVVIGGGTHTVFYTANDAVDATALQNAIDDALDVAGIDTQDPPVSGLSVLPNPASEKAYLKFSLSGNSTTKVQLFDLRGKLVQDVFSRNLSKGENLVEVQTRQLAAGTYLVKISDGSSNSFINLVVSH